MKNLSNDKNIIVVTSGCDLGAIIIINKADSDKARTIITKARNEWNDRCCKGLSNNLLSDHTADTLKDNRIDFTMPDFEEI